MTRWARGGNANKKKPHEASSWEQLKREMGKQSPKPHKLLNKKPLKRENLNQAHRGTNKITSSISQTKAHKKQRFEEYFKTEHTRKSKSVGSDSRSASKHNNVPVKKVHTDKNKARTSTVEDKNKKLQSSFMDPPSSSSKSIVDVLLEADRMLTEDKKGSGVNSGTSHTGESDLHVFEGQMTLEVFQKKEKRREERRLKRQKKKADNMVCFHCRQPGHGVADCLQIQEDVEQGTGICFRCGSTEHDVSKCNAKVDKKLGEFPYAKCFICQQTGHLSRMCPDNPRGLYPEGGGCKECGSVEHRWWNCPVRKPVKGANVSAAHMVTSSKRAHMSADAEPAFMKRAKVKEKKSGPKVVMF